MQEERGKEGSEGLLGIPFWDTEKWIRLLNCKVILSWEAICVEMCYEHLKYMTEGLG